MTPDQLAAVAALAAIRLALTEADAAASRAATLATETRPGDAPDRLRSLVAACAAVRRHAQDASAAATAIERAALRIAGGSQ